jgi:hypothetical protein
MERRIRDANSAALTDCGPETVRNKLGCIQKELGCLARSEMGFLLFPTRFEKSSSSLTFKNCSSVGSVGSGFPLIVGGTVIDAEAPEILICLNGAVERHPLIPTNFPVVAKQLWKRRIVFPGPGMRSQLYGYVSAESISPCPSRRYEKVTSSLASKGWSKRS